MDYTVTKLSLDEINALLKSLARAGFTAKDLRDIAAEGGGGSGRRKQPTQYLTRAMHKALEVQRTQLVPENFTPTKPSPEELFRNHGFLSKSVDELDLSTYLSNRLRLGKIEYIWQVVQLSREQQRAIGIGPKTREKLKELLEELNLTLP